jgi:hypothetical protein
MTAVAKARAAVLPTALLDPRAAVPTIGPITAADTAATAPLGPWTI